MKILRIISLYNYLLRKKIVQKNSIAMVNRIKVIKKERTHLTKDEIDILLPAIDHPIVHYVVVMMLNTSIRIREYIELSLQTVDLVEKEVHIIEGKGCKRNAKIPIKYHSPPTNSLC
ncbi:hypothetical protein [Psychrobacillus sp. NPDC096389]|uniref:hypothetical protein n=1 Tax=Psychrobacillus sp. NPDC096389 TaxID=3364490 RepID=UPI00380CE50C